MASHQRYQDGLFTAEGRQSTKARESADLTDPPSESYAQDSKKEALCLEYVRQFRSKFVALFPKRRELFLAPQNEFGCSKFVCTTVRPTLLPFDQLYEAEPLAKFVANFLQYEPLEAPDAFPSVLPRRRKLWTGSAATASISRGVTM